MIGEILRSGSVAPLALAAIADPVEPGGSQHETWYSDYREVLDSEVSAVIIATPPALHYSIANQALRSGKDVYVEKPPARSAAEARQLARTAKVNGRVLFFAYHARYNPAVPEARAFLEGAELRGIEVRTKENAGNFHSPHNWVREEGVLRDSGINVFSVLTELIPAAADLHIISRVFTAPAAGGSPTKAKIELNGRIHIDMDWEYTGPEVRLFEILTGGGRCSIDLSRGVFLVNGIPRHSPEHKRPATRDVLRAEYEAMLGDWSERLQSRESCSSTREMELLDQAEAMPPPSGQPASN